MTKSTPTSASLIRRLADPLDREAWDRYLKIYTPVILHWLDRLGIKPSDSDDATQEIMAKLHREMQRGFRYDPTQSFRGWLYTLARSEAVNR